jgi:uncharacterized protein (TIGR02145 family)
MRIRIAILTVLIAGIGGVSFGQNTSNRIALVIGAQNYSVLPPLHNSLNDARAMATKLKSKGFEVEALYDPKSKREIRDAITRYYNIMRDKVGAVGLIFYAGHGMQYEGDNYLIPTTASLQNPGDLEDQCVKMNTVMAVLKSANKSLNILLLDACRSLPSFTRDTDQGLTRMEAPQGSIIVFAAQAGKTASDGNRANGLFTSNLIQVLDEPNLNITEVFKKVKQQVYAESGEKQLPSVEDNSIGGDFYFTTGSARVVETKNAEPNETPTLTTSTTDFGYDLDEATIVSVGTKTWSAKNLNVSIFSNGEVIKQAKNYDDWNTAQTDAEPAWCYYDFDASKGKIYGKLYNQWALTDARSLAPKGWHVPSDSEWSALINYLGGEKSAGLKMKSISNWYNDGNGDNSSGLSLLPGGVCCPNQNIKKAGYFWTSEGHSIILLYNSSALKRDFLNKDIHFGFSVRCIKD